MGVLDLEVAGSGKTRLFSALESVAGGRGRIRPRSATFISSSGLKAPIVTGAPRSVAWLRRSSMNMTTPAEKRWSLKRHCSALNSSISTKSEPPGATMMKCRHCALVVNLRPTATKRPHCASQVTNREFAKSQTCAPHGAVKCSHVPLFCLHYAWHLPQPEHCTVILLPPLQPTLGANTQL